VLVAVALLALPFVLLRIDPVRERAVACVAFIRDGGAVGVAVYYLVYAVGVLATAPIWLFSGVAGYAFGLGRGLVLASSANLVATMSAFLVGRFALAGRLDRWLGPSPRWRAVHRAVASDALRIALLVRLSPIAPQNIMSYVFSFTPMRLRTFAVATWLGLLPITAFHVYVGSLVKDATDLVEGKRPPLGVWGWMATTLGVVVSIVALGVVARIGQRALVRHGVL
jgi:uncharacterized membrane protein YdjX (TVP38/TMEM64 family)